MVDYVRDGGFGGGGAVEPDVFADGEFFVGGDFAAVVVADFAGAEALRDVIVGCLPALGVDEVLDEGLGGPAGFGYFHP